MKYVYAVALVAVMMAACLGIGFAVGFKTAMPDDLDQARSACKGLNKFDAAKAWLKGLAD